MTAPGKAVPSLADFVAKAGPDRNQRRMRCLICRLPDEVRAQLTEFEKLRVEAKATQGAPPVTRPIMAEWLQEIGYSEGNYSSSIENHYGRFSYD